MRSTTDLHEPLRRPARAPKQEDAAVCPPSLRIAVVGGGIAGLTLAHHLRNRLEVTVYEGAPHAGGHAVTVQEHGFLVEAGASAFHERHAGLRRLADQLGLSSDLVPALPAAGRRYVLRRGRLHLVPDSARSILTTGALSPMGKLRLLLEPIIPRRRIGREETVDEFACRRMGREAAEILVNAAVAGSIFAGDSRQLSAHSAFPQLTRSERNRIHPLRALASPRGSAASGSTLMTFRHGVSELVAGLVGALGPRLRTASPVRRIEREDDSRWRVVLAGGEVHVADRVVLALPASRAAPLIEHLNPVLSGQLALWKFVGVAVVAFGFRAADVPRPLDGYGFFVPRSEQKATLGAVFDSSVFPGRAPEGAVLIRVFLGGTRHPDLLRAPREERIALARRELSRILGITAPPLHTWEFEWPDAIAQYLPHHGERLSEARLRSTLHPGLLLCGTSYEGITIDAAVESGLAHAERILTCVE